MRVLLLLESFDLDDTGLLLHRLCQRWVAQEGDVELQAIGFCEDGPLAERMRADGIPAEILPPDASASKVLLKKRAHSIQRMTNPPSLIQAHGRWPFEYGLRLAEQMPDHPAVFVSHGNEPDAGWLDQLRRRLSERRARARWQTVLADTQFGADRLRERGLPAARVQHFPFGVDAIQCHPLGTATRARIRHLADVPEKAPFVVTDAPPPTSPAGRALIAGIVSVLREYPEARVRMLDAQARDSGWDTVLASANLSDRVRVIGQLPEVRPRLLASADVVIQATLRDGFPLAVAEAMAGAVPVVAMDHGSVATLLEQGKTGVLVPPNNAVALADATGRLLADPAASLKIGQAARAAVTEENELGHVAESFVKLWRGLIGLPTTVA